MAKNQQARKDAIENEPVNIGGRALDNLQFIRETMERSVHFTAVPGYGGMLMGATAIAAAYIASNQPRLGDWLITWLVEAALAFAIGLLAMWQKSRISGESMFSTPARKFALSFAPPLIVGVVITLALLRKEFFTIMPPTWMLCYGASVVCGGAFSVRVVPVMGWCFIAMGTIAFLLPADYINLAMAASFGLLHIVFGAVIAKKYGG